ncbi:MAG: hypothetical protein NC320_10960 [Clostridium sp.]|nr:hypothetical protein [Clostridium sp.]MCM1548159.1 hypothetical protein [Ruminococcus sp.]
MLKTKVNKIAAFFISAVMMMSMLAVLPEKALEVSAATSSDFSISQNIVNFICAREGFSSKCYYDGNQSSIELKRKNMEKLADIL